MYQKLLTIVAVLGTLTFNAGAWDYEGHHAINETGAGVVAGGFRRVHADARVQEPHCVFSRRAGPLRNVGDLPLKHFNGPDHYIDLEDLKLYSLTPETLPLMRYDFVAIIARERMVHPDKFHH